MCKEMGFILKWAKLQEFMVQYTCLSQYIVIVMASSLSQKIKLIILFVGESMGEQKRRGGGGINYHQSDSMVPRLYTV